MIFNYSILQAREDVSYKFSPWSGAKEKFSGGDYDTVYNGSVVLEDFVPEDEVLEMLFSMYNRDVKPKGYKGHNLSVSDVVKLNDNYYYCDFIDWKKI